MSVDQAVKQFPRVSSEGRSDLDELHHVDAPFPGLHPPDEGMRAAKPHRELSLCDAGLLASGNQDTDQCLVPPAAQGLPQSRRSRHGALL